MNEKSKPFALEYAEAREEIIAAINSATQTHRVPCFLLETMVENILQQLKIGANAERAEAEYIYNKQIAEAEKQEEEDNE